VELLIALVVFGGAFGLGYWQLRGDTRATIWIVTGLAAAAAVVGLVLGFLFGAFAVFVIGVVAASALVFGYRWLARRKTAQPAATSAAQAAPSAPTTAEKVCPECAELVEREDRACRFCGYRFDGLADEPAPAPDEAVVQTRPAVPAIVEPVAEEAVRTAGVAASALLPEPRTEAVRYCAGCGTEFEADARFCGTCGAPRP
jgi:hypothetical protein